MKYTIDEFIDLIVQDLTIGGALDNKLPATEIQRIVETKAQPWFYQNYHYSLSKMYYYIDKRAFESEEWTQYKYLNLPCEIQNIVWIYPLKSASLFSLGINSPNLSLNLGVSSQPYLTSYVSTIGELGVYKSIIDSFSDMLDQFSLFTVKYHYNQMTNRLNILTSVEDNLILEVFANVPSEDLYGDPLFIKYATAMCKVQLGNLYTRYDFTLPGAVKVNGESLISQGQAEIAEVEEKVKSLTSSSWFFMVKR